MKLKLSNKKLISLLLVMMLTVAMALTGCGEKKDGESTKATQSAKNTNDPQSTQSVEANVLGEGNTKFELVVVDKEGSESSYIIKTDKKTVGEALVELDIIEGEDGPYGLYIKTVNGITADYDQDKTYWAFYIDGEYATTGADQTDIEEGVTYTFKVEK